MPRVSQLISDGARIWTQIFWLKSQSMCFSYLELIKLFGPLSWCLSPDLRHVCSLFHQIIFSYPLFLSFPSRTSVVCILECLILFHRSLRLGSFFLNISTLFSSDFIFSHNLSSSLLSSAISVLLFYSSMHVKFYQMLFCICWDDRMIFLL